MKFIYHKLLFISVFTFLTSSCDDFLNVQPKSEKLEYILFQDAQGFEDAINGVYGSLQQRELYGKNLLWGIPEVLAQNLNGQSDAMVSLAKYDYTNNDALRQTLRSIWVKGYETIGFANNILNQLEKKSPSELSLYNVYKGEMLGVRALLHFDLLRLFASMDMSARGIPYLKDYSYKVQDFQTVSKNYENILADLKEAETLLKSDESIIAFPKDNNKYSKFLNYRETHFNLYAVYALLSRVYWMKGDMPNAAIYARKVIDSGKFPLSEDYEIKDYIAGVLSPKETIFGVYSLSYMNTAKDYLYKYLSFYSYNPYVNASGSKRLLPYQEVYKKDIDATTQDFRLNHFKDDSGISLFWKLVDYKKIENLPEADKGNPIHGINLMRSAELYLIAAEALLDSDYNKALEYFNKEINSRGLPSLKEGVQLTKDMIFNEYHKELFGEGQLWYNMKRLNKDIISNMESKIIKASDLVYVIPIPKEEFEYRVGGMSNN